MSNYQQCARCLMDTTAKDIIFNDDGFCNFCTDYLNSSFAEKIPKVESYDDFVSKVKKSGRGKKYDCIIGVSGGVDSSWVLVNAVKSGLRPLAVHMDNGWNSELAQNNIYNLISRLGVDFYSHVIDWGEYRGLMQSFFDADVIDVELLYDNAMTAVNYRMASKYNIKYILSGQNMATEGIAMPDKWNWFKYDSKNIIDIARKNGNVKIKTFPLFSIFDYFYYRLIRRINWTSPLDHMFFNKEDALVKLEMDFSYKRYPYKHYESIFTRFYQGHILPIKFGVDKRKLHLSTLVASGQLNRDAGLAMLEGSPYPIREDLQIDKQYFLKKMRWTEDALNSYLSRPPVPHSNYNSSYQTWKLLKKVYKWRSK